MPDKKPTLDSGRPKDSRTARALKVAIITVIVLLALYIAAGLYEIRHIAEQFRPNAANQSDFISN